MMVNRSPVTVIPTRTGSTISISTDRDILTAAITVMQKKYDIIVGQGLQVETRVADLIDGLDRMVSLELKPGDMLTGNIVIKQQTYPISEEEIERCMLVDKSGVPLKDDKGNCIWHFSFYTENPEEQDEIIRAVYL